MNILILDQNPTNRSLSSTIFLSLEWQPQVTEATTPSEASVLLQQQEFDCLVLNCTLPPENALQLLRDLRAQSSLTPIIVLTTPEQEQIAMEFIQAGASDTLSRNGLNSDLLQHTLRTAIRLKHAEQDRFLALETLRQAAERQALMVATQQAIAKADRNLDTVLDTVVQRAQEMTKADGAVVELADGDDMVYRSASGTAAAHLGMRLRRATSLSGRCVAEGRLISCNDSETDERVDREACRKIGLRSMVVVPLQFLGQTIGVLKVYSAKAHAFSDDDLPLLEMMVSLIVAALSNVAESEARQALAVVEERQQFTIESAGIGTWHWDIPKGSLIWSERCKVLFGLPTDAPVTRELFYECIHPEDREATQAAIEQALDKQLPYDVEYRVVWPNGTIRWVASKGRGEYDAQGWAVRFEGIIQDIDEKKRTVEQQRTFLREVLSSVTEGKLQFCSVLAELPAPLSLSTDPIPLNASGGLRDLRQQTQEAAIQAGQSDERQYDLVTAASEAGMNAIVHGGGGVARVSSDESGVVQVRVEDHGMGIEIDFLPKATLSRGFSTKASLGHGIKMMLDLADRIYLLTGPTIGTTVVIEQDRVAPLPAWLRDQ